MIYVNYTVGQVKKRKKKRTRTCKFSSVPFSRWWEPAVNASRYDQAVFILESPWNDGFLPFQLIEDGSRIKEGRGAIDEFFTLWLTVFQSVQRNCISSIRVRIVFASCHYDFSFVFVSILRRNGTFLILRFIFFFFFISNVFLANLHFPQPLMTSSFLLICILNAEHRWLAMGSSSKSI